MNEYIILPAIGFRSESLRHLERAVRGMDGPRPLSVGAAGDEGAAADFDVIDRIAKDGPKVVRMDPEVARDLRRHSTDLKIAPVRQYQRALSPMRVVRSKGLFVGATARTSVRLRIVNAKGRAPVESATVVAVLDRERGFGLPRRRSGASGQVTLTFPTAQTRLEELLVYPRQGTWGFYARNIDLTDGQEIALQPIDLGEPDLLQATFPTRGGTGAGVRVGVIDSGVDADHRDLTVFGGANFAGDGGPADGRAGADGHGTHVAGILAGTALPGAGMRGIAPKAQLYSYRVFPHDGGSTSNVAILKAITRAIEDRCDILNLSLGGGLGDVALNAGIGEAYDHGTVCIVAAGNDGRKDVSYPAWYKRAVAVSALGREGAFPAQSTEVCEVEAPRPAGDPTLFIAGFSNVGYEIDFTAPGVGIVSCFPDNRYAVMSGTSMACPVVSGVAAALLSAERALLAAPRDRERSRRIVELLRASARDVGFPRLFQGFGMPAP